MRQWVSLALVLVMLGACRASSAAPAASPAQPASAGGSGPPPPPNPGGSLASPGAGSPPGLGGLGGAAPDSSAGLGAAPPPLAPTVTVKVASLNSLTDSGLFIAMDRGYFAAEGLEIETTRVDGAPQAIPHLATGQLDAAGVTPSAALYNAVARGVPLHLAIDKARISTGRSSTLWVLREDVAASGAVRDWSDLRGMALGLNVPNSGSSPDIILDRALERGGLTRDDVQIVELPYPDMNAAFANRQIDAAIETEPQVTQGEERGILRRWRSAADVAPGLNASVWLFSPDFAETEAAKRFTVAYLRGVRDYNDAIVYGRNKPAVVDILTRYTTVKDARLYDKMDFTDLDPSGLVDPQRLAEDVQYFVAKGYLQQPVDVGQIIDRRFTDYAASRLGPYHPPSP
jgi:NitT/TauT family transport system substrate-binding protein